MTFCVQRFVTVNRKSLFKCKINCPLIKRWVTKGISSYHELFKKFLCELLSIIIAVYSILMKTKDIFCLQWYEGTEDTKI